MYTLVFAFVLLTGVSSTPKFYEDPYGSHFKRSHISPIPQVGSADPRVNLGQEQALGQIKFLRSFVEQSNYKTTVFKIKMERERIVLSDPVAIRAIFDDNKVYKVAEVGALDQNPTSTRGYTPSFIDNGKSHQMKKKRQYKQLVQRMRKFGLRGIYDLMTTELANIEPIDSQTPVNVTDTIDQATQNIMIKFLLGKSLNNVELFRQWFLTSFKINPNLDPNAAAKEPVYKAIADRMFAFIKSTPYVQDATECQKSYKHFEGEQVWFTIWLAAAGVVSAQKHVVREYYNLPACDREDIEREAKRFFNSLGGRSLPEYIARKRFHYRFKRLHFITKFALETIRLNSPVNAISARARHDFVLTSLNGRFLIKKDDYLLANVLNSMRNPRRLRNPSKFDMDRKIEDIRRNIYAFGGPYYQRPTLKNHKCIGQEVALDFMKMFVLQLTRCDVKLTSSDPLQVTKFICQPSPLKPCLS